jgi:hypothetical protein
LPGLTRQSACFLKKMDARIKSAHDEATIPSKAERLYSVFERSGFRFASRKRVNAKTWSIFAIQGNAKML